MIGTPPIKLQAALTHSRSEWAAASEFLGTEVGATNGTTAFHLYAGIGDAERFSEINQQSPTATAFYSMQLVCPDVFTNVCLHVEC